LVLLKRLLIEVILYAVHQNILLLKLFSQRVIISLWIGGPLESSFSRCLLDILHFTTTIL
jgi:hypothetical protein